MTLRPEKGSSFLLVLVLEKAGQIASGPSEDSEEERHRSVYAHARVSSASRSTSASTKNLFRNSLQLEPVMRHL